MSRLYNEMKSHDVICISADKYLPDRLDYETQDEYEKEFENRLGKYKKYDRQALLIQLKGKGYGVFKVKGFYQYNSKSVPSKEYSFCVINRNDDKNFLEELLNLAVKCKQNSIYYVPKNTFEGSWIYTGIDLSEKDEVDTNIKKIKTKNIHNNVTIIDESICEVETLKVDSHTSDYIRKFKTI